MPDVSVLNIRLYDHPIATLTNVQGDRSIFAFNDDYVVDAHRPTLSLSFKDSLGGLITDFKPIQRRILPFFSNLLPEGHLRRYLAERAGVNSEREFFLLWMLGLDLPGALSVHPSDGEELPPGANEPFGSEKKPNLYRFSLAGVQLKFSALQHGKRGLTIPVNGVGGEWILKLPSQQFQGIPENEFSMMKLAGLMGMEVPEVDLIDLDKVTGIPEGLGELRGQALAVRRFDRTLEGPIHIEDFAQIFGVYPDDKYGRASYRNIAAVLATEIGDTGVAEFIRRLVFSTLIGNADMHLKNWSLIYPDRINAALSPAYDFLSTIPYVPDETAALKYSRTKRMDGLTIDELSHLAAKAQLPERLVISTAAEVVDRFKEIWTRERAHLPLAKDVADLIDRHAATIPLMSDF